MKQKYQIDKWLKSWLWLLPAMLLLLISRHGETTAQSVRPTAAEDWSTPQNISALPLGETPRIIQSPNGTLLAVYVQSNNGIEKPYYRLMPPTATSWGSATPIWNTANTQDVDLPMAAFDSQNRAHAVWASEGSIRYARQDRWPNDPLQLSSNVVLDATYPVITIGSDDRIHIAWIQGNTFDLYYSSSSDGGVNWSSPEEIPTGDGEVEYPFLLTDANNNLFVLWQSFNQSQYFVLVNRKGPAEAWSAGQTVLLSLGIMATYPTAVAWGDEIFVTYVRRNQTNEQIVEYTPYYVRLSAENLTSPPPQQFGRPVYINTLSPFYVSATTFLCNDKIYYYYHGGLGLNLPEQITGFVFTKNQWSAEDQVTNTTGTNLNVYPSLTCRNRQLHMVYQTVSTNTRQATYVSRDETERTYLPLITK